MSSAMMSMMGGMTGGAGETGRMMLQQGLGTLLRPTQGPAQLPQSMPMPPAKLSDAAKQEQQPGQAPIAQNVPPPPGGQVNPLQAPPPSSAPPGAGGGPPPDFLEWLKKMQAESAPAYDPASFGDPYANPWGARR